MEGVLEMIKIMSVKVDSGYYKINYAKETESANMEFYSLESKDSPRPEFIEAVLGLKTLLLNKFSLFKFNANLVNVYAVQLKYGGKGYPKDAISNYKLIGGTVNKSNDYCKLATQMIKVSLDKEDMANDILNNLTNEAALYIRGKRAQVSLFETENEDANKLKVEVNFLESNSNSSEQQGVVQ